MDIKEREKATEKWKNQDMGIMNYCPKCNNNSVHFDPYYNKMVCSQVSCGYMGFADEYDQHIDGLKAAHKIP
jgi:hypothetical protein